MTSKKETNNNYYFIKGIGGYALAVVVVVIIIITLIYERSVGLFVCPVLRGEKNSVASDPIALDLIGGNDLPVVPPTTTTTTTTKTTKTTKTTISHSQPIITNSIESSTKLPEDTYSDKYITKAPPRNATLLLIILLRLHFNNSLPYVSKTDPKGINFMKTTIILRNTFQDFLAQVGFTGIQHISVRLTFYDSDNWINSVMVLVYADWIPNMRILQHYNIGHGSGSNYGFNFFPDCETNMLSYYFLKMTNYKGYLSTIKYPGDLLSLRWTTKTTNDLIENLHPYLKLCVNSQKFQLWKPFDCLRYYTSAWYWICDGVNRTYELHR